MHWRRDEIDDPASTTCQWILEHESYKKWYEDQRGLLWIKGKPGAGKSTVLKFAFEAAKQNNKGLILASFFFHGRGAPIQKNSLGLFRSLLHQILQQVPDLLATFATLYRQRCNTEGQHAQNWDWSEKDLQKFFSSHVTETAKTFPIRLYIDALDECGEDPAVRLVGYLCHFAETVAICFACRHYPIISLEQTGTELSVEDENTRDIDAYIMNQIRLPIQEEERATMIRRELRQRSNGNFQWVVLVIPRVIQFHKRGKSSDAIYNLIRNVPSELADMYKKLIEELDPQDLRQALHMMQWICFAFRSLTLQELREAIALDIHTSYASLEESRIFGQYAASNEEMERRVLSLSQGLAEVVTHDSSRIVQLVHQSVMDFLLQEGFRLYYEQLPDDRLKGSVIARGHFWISRACIKYMSMVDVTPFRKTMRRTRLDSYWEIRAQCNERLTRFVLMKYAVENWIAHAQIVEQENVLQDDLVTLFQPPSSVIRAIHEWCSYLKATGRYRQFLLVPEATLLHIASFFGLLSVVSCILERDTLNIEIEARDYYGDRPLHYAVRGGHEAIVRHLLGKGAEKNAQNNEGNTPMHYAASEGHRGIVYLLLKPGAEFYPLHIYGKTPLS